VLAEPNLIHFSDRAACKLRKTKKKTNSPFSVLHITSRHCSWFLRLQWSGRMQETTGRNLLSESLFLWCRQCRVIDNRLVASQKSFMLYQILL